MKAANKILLLDIETAPAKAYVWGLHDVNIGTEQLLDPGGVIMVGMKWLGQRQVTVLDKWDSDTMLEAVAEKMAEADAIIGYNSDKFDLPKLKGEFIKHNVPLPPPCASIDLWKTARALGLISSKLAHVGPYFGIGEKVKHEGFSLWAKVLDGDRKALERMRKYCEQDVRLLEPLYEKLRPYIKTHPYMAGTSGACPACGSKHAQSRGTRRTKAFIITRMQCLGCGSWYDGTRRKA